LIDKLARNFGTIKVYALLHKVVLTLHALLMVFVVIRTIPNYEFGLLTLVNTFDLLIFSISGGLVFQALQKYAAEEDGEELSLIVGNSILLYTGITVCLSIIVALLANPIAVFLRAESLAALLRLMPLILVSHLGRKVGYHVLIAKEQVKRVFISDLIPFLVTAFLIIALFFFNALKTALAVIVVIIVANFIGSIINFGFMKKVVHFKFSLDTKWIRKLFDFGKYSFGTTVGDMIHSKIDIFMITYFIDPVAVALYSAAKRIAEFFRNFVQAANIVVLPRASNLFAKRDIAGVRNTYYKGLIYSLVMIAPVTLILILIPNSILYLAYEDKYLESAAVLQIVALSALISPIGTIGSSIAGGVGKPKFTFIAMWISVILNIGLNLLLIPKYGALGAALATLGAMLVGGGAITLMIHRTVNLSFSELCSSIKSNIGDLLKIRS